MENLKYIQLYLDNTRKIITYKVINYDKIYFVSINSIVLKKTEFRFY